MSEEPNTEIKPNLIALEARVNDRHYELVDIVHKLEDRVNDFIHENSKAERLLLDKIAELKDNIADNRTILNALDELYQFQAGSMMALKGFLIGVFSGMKYDAVVEALQKFMNLPKE